MLVMAVEPAASVLEEGDCAGNEDIDVRHSDQSTRAEGVICNSETTVPNEVPALTFRPSVDCSNAGHLHTADSRWDQVAGCTSALEATYAAIPTSKWMQVYTTSSLVRADVPS